MHFASLLQLWPRVVAIAAAGLGLGLGVNLGRTGSPFAQAPETVACQGGHGQVAEITPAQAAELCSDARVLVLDARPPELFAAGHVANAVHLPCSQDRIESAFADRLHAAPTVIVYGQSSAEAAPVAAGLEQHGAQDVRVLEGGYPAWERAGLACSSGACDECLGQQP